jgi:predicted DNA-binding protein YlxM (UPF0122 family)
MYEITDSTTDEEIGDIITLLWKRHLSLAEIAAETNLPVSIVRQKLKRIEKEIVKNSGLNHEN